MAHSRTEPSPDAFAFGTAVRKKAQDLATQGKDANQTAKVLYDADPDGHNYGIGILLGPDGQAMSTSPTLLDYTRREVERSTQGRYQNSSALSRELAASVLAWQRIPEAMWGSFVLALPSDAGTGALKSAIEVALGMRPALSAIRVEPLGWPAYKALAKSCRVGVDECEPDGVIAGDDVLPVYQAGPMNTTGRVPRSDVVVDRARSAADRGEMVLLDRAYSGFEFARRCDDQGYDAVMHASYERQLRPFLERGVTTFIAVSPTKCFRSFALRPAGFLLIFAPDRSLRQELQTTVNGIMRARGSSFEHPATRALVRAMVDDREALERDHAAALQRVAEAERAWATLTAGTPMEPLFSDDYAGLFRNPGARPGADVHLYAEHIYPVFSSGRCRINVTGIPGDADLQRTHVAAFAGQCGADAP